MVQLRRSAPSLRPPSAPRAPGLRAPRPALSRLGFRLFLSAARCVCCREHAASPKDGVEGNVDRWTTATLSLHFVFNRRLQSGT